MHCRRTPDVTFIYIERSYSTALIYGIIIQCWQCTQKWIETYLLLSMSPVPNTAQSKVGVVPGVTMYMFDSYFKKLFRSYIYWSKKEYFEVLGTLYTLNVVVYKIFAFCIQIILWIKDISLCACFVFSCTCSVFKPAFIVNSFLFL